MTIIKGLISIVFFLVLSTSASANELRCSTIGDALDSVKMSWDTHLYEENVMFISISFSNDTEVNYFSPLSRSVLSKLGHDETTLIGKSEESFQFGGAYTKSALLSLSQDMTKALLAHGSTVYQLNCQAPELTTNS